MQIQLTLIIVFIASFTAVAQPDYNQLQSSIREIRSNEAYLDAIREKARTPNSPLYSNKPQNNQPLSESQLTDLWRSASGRNDPSRTAEANMARFRAADKADAAEREAKEKAQSDILKKSSNVRQALLKAGFGNGTEEDGEWLEDFAYGNAEVRERINALLAALIVNKNAFNANKTTASPLELLSSIASYLPAWKTALADLQWVEGEHPAYKGKIDTLRLYALGYYYGMETPYGQISHGGYLSPAEDKLGYQKITEEVFAPLAQQYLGLALTIAGQASRTRTGAERNPFVQLAALYNRRSYALDKSHAAEKAQLQYKGATNLLNALNVRRPADNAPLNLKDLRWSDEFDRMFAAFTVADWKDICAGLNEDFGMLLESMGVTDRGYFPRLIQGRMEYDRYTKGKRGNKFWKESVLAGAMEKMAAAGDREAQNLMGVNLLQFARKFNPSEAINLFRQAAAKGSLPAQINLYLATSLPIDYSGEAARSKEQSALIAAINSAGKMQLLACRQIFVDLTRGGGYNASNHDYINPAIRQVIDAKFKSVGLEKLIW